jgi:hypothetical protein
MMKHIAGLTMTAAATLALLAAPAAAQPGVTPPGATPPPPPRTQGPPGPPPSAPLQSAFFPRHGLTLGGGFGLGAMNSERGIVDCRSCSEQPGAVGLDFHIGGMLNERVALLFELWVTGQSIDRFGSAILWQSMAMAAMQYWVTPQLWIKGGLGFAHLSLEENTGYYALQYDVDDGGAVMGAIGYEILSSPYFAIDLSLRLGAGTYRNYINDKVTAGTLGLGVSWY